MSNDLMSSLEKLAEDSYVEKVVRMSPDDRIEEIALDLRQAPPEYLRAALEQEGLLEYAVEQGHFKDITPTEGAVGVGSIGLLGGAALGGLSNGPKGLLGGAAIGGALGAGAGYLAGKVLEHSPSDTHEAIRGSGGTKHQYRSNAGSVGHEEAGVAKSASIKGGVNVSNDLLVSLEKTANEIYPNEGRINRGLLAESFLGTGPVGYYAKKNNALGIKEDDSHLAANAKLMAAGQGTLGAGAGALTAGLTSRILGHGRAATLAGVATGGVVGGALNTVQGGVIGGINGALHDAYDSSLRKKNQVDGFEQEASNALLPSLEKTANEAIQEAQKDLVEKADAFNAYPNAPGIRAATGLGSIAAGAGGGALLGNKLGEKAGAIGGGVLGGAVGMTGGLMAQVPISHKLNKNNPGRLEALNDYIQSAQNYEDSLVSTASNSLLNSLEKTARTKWLKGIKDTFVNATGKNQKGYRDALNRNNTVEALQKNVEKGIPVSQHRQSLEVLDKNLNAQKEVTRQARKNLAIGGGSAATAAAATTAVMPKRDEEKTASEEFMSDLYKEAATAILDSHVPEVKDYNDPIHRIKFD